MELIIIPPPSGTHRPQLTSQNPENQAALHSVVSAAQRAQVASGQSGSGGGNTSIQGLALGTALAVMLAVVDIDALELGAALLVPAPVTAVVGLTLVAAAVAVSAEVAVGRAVVAVPSVETTLVAEPVRTTSPGAPPGSDCLVPQPPENAKIASNPALKTEVATWGDFENGEEKAVLGFMLPT